MRDDIDTVLNDLLCSWHRWTSRYRYGRGYPSADVACRPARASRQYDDENGALDAALDNSIMEAFDAAMNRVEQPGYTALACLARNLSVGACVWKSPRLPQDPIERGILLMEARNKLLKELAGDGVLS